LNHSLKRFIKFQDIKGFAMSQICAWCNKVINSHDNGQDGTITHGICPDCTIKMRETPGEPLMQFLDKLGVPVVLVATDVVVVTANEQARHMLNKNLGEIEGFISGEVFECANATLPGGCGRTIHCSGCTIRGTVTDTFLTGRNYTHTPAFINHRREGLIDLFISTEKVGDVVLLKIEKANGN
jgi:hypothetical protein